MSTPADTARPALSAKTLGWPRPRPISGVVTILIALIFPFIISDPYWIGVATLALIWMVLNQSWNLVLGFSGVWNFGQLGIYAVGGYSAALLSLHTGLPWFISLILGGVAAMAVSIVLAVPSLRLRGIYVSLLTFGFAEVIRLLIIADKSDVTGGTFGLSGFDGYGLQAMDPDSRARTIYWIAVAVVLITLAVLFFVIRSPLGTGLTALRDNSSLAAARGVSPLKYQMVSFAISGFFAGVAGGMYAFTYGVVSPSLMGLGPMTLLVTMLAIGGLGTLTGPIVGTVILTYVQAELQRWPEFRLILLGLLLLVIVIVIPRGVVPLVSTARERLSAWMAESDDGDEANDGPPDPPSEDASRPG